MRIESLDACRFPVPFRVVFGNPQERLFEARDDLRVDAAAVEHCRLGNPVAQLIGKP